MKRFVIYIVLSTSLFLHACSVHKLDIQQGNVLTPEMLDQLKPGINKKQVVFILGTPLIVDPFHKDRWDYVYTSKESDKEPERYHITLYFDGDTLARIEEKAPPPREQQTDD